MAAHAVIFTDLDGTLLDHETYSADAAADALARATRDGVPVVLCSSKTLAEMRPLARRLHLPEAPLIVENGGAVWFPSSWTLPDGAPPRDADGVVVLGATSAALRPLLETLAARVGCALRGFSAMTDAEVAERTGLPEASAALARRRGFSEPFVCDGAAIETARLDAEARGLGARVTRGGRFFHLTGQSDKGAAVQLVRRAVGGTPTTLGLGDAPNDLPLLQAVDAAVIVPQIHRGPHPELVAALPQASQAPAPGPAGWNAAVLRWLAALAAR